MRLLQRWTYGRCDGFFAKCLQASIEFAAFEGPCWLSDLQAAGFVVVVAECAVRIAPAWRLACLAWVAEYPITDAALLANKLLNQFKAAELMESSSWLQIIITPQAHLHNS